MSATKAKAAANAQTKAAAPKTEKKVLTFQEMLGALMYSEDPNTVEGKPIAYDDLSVEVQKAWIERAGWCLIALDKMNKIVTEKPAAEAMNEHDRRTQNIDTMEALIKEFNLRLKPKKPLTPAYYPSRELAMFILNK